MKVKYHLLLLAVVLFAVAALFMSSLTFLLSDVGLRFLQIRELIAHNWQTFAISYPARPYDPELAHVPYYYAYSIIENEIYLNITPFLPLLASWFFALLGPVGLAIVPVGGTVLAATAVYQLASLTKLPHPQRLLWITVFCTPLLFYTFELWDHTLAVGCAAWSVAGLIWAVIRGRWQPAFLAGLMLGFGLGQRPEMYVFALSLGLAAVFILRPYWKMTLILVAGSLVGILPIWWWQYRWVGHPLGMALAANLWDYGRPESYPFMPDAFTFSRPITIGRLLILIQSHDMLTFAAALLVLVGVVVLVLCLRVEKWRQPRLLYAGLVLCLLGYGFFVFQAAQLTMLTGLITTFPIICFSLAFVSAENDHGRYRQIYLFILTSTMLFLGSMFLAWPVSGGLQWGARYLLAATPLLVYLAAYNIHAYDQMFSGKLQRTLKQTVIGLLAVSLIIQLAGLHMQWRKHQEAQQIQAFVNGLPAEVILTNGPFLAAHISGVDSNKMFMYVADEQDVITLIPRLLAGGIHRVAILPLEYIPLTVPERVGDIRLKPTQEFVYDLERAE
ncbi:MAG: hypothetical protein GY796_32220 [Chloroflexi bacterium]|nr:hypothetical protein [Chloroflexota bacterium]